MHDTKEWNAWVIGGDSRYPHAVGTLRAKGLPVRTFGVGSMPNDAPDLRTAIKNANQILLPLSSLESGWLEAEDDRMETALIPVLLRKGSVIAAGRIPGDLALWSGTFGVRCESLLEQEPFQIANAAVTAEGALGLALQVMDRTLFGAQVLVIGWGRIGKLLAGKLCALGARVTVSGRRPAQLAEIEAMGYRPEVTGVYGCGLKDYDIIINTVPATVLEASQAENTKEDCILMELATLPGGFTSEVRWMRNVVLAPGLPGRTAPRSAGEILAEAFLDCIGGEECSLE